MARLIRTGKFLTGLRNWPFRVGFLILAISTAENFLSWRIGLGNLRLEHLGLGVVIAGSLSFFIKNRLKFIFSREDLLLLLYLFVTFISSLFFAPHPGESFKFLGLMLFAAFLYIFTLQLLRVGLDTSHALLILTGVGVAVELYGIIAWLLYPFGLDIGVSLYRLFNGPALELENCSFSPHGTLVEPNIFGSYCLAVTLLAVGLKGYKKFPPLDKHLVTAALILGPVALALSLSRGAWAGFGAGMLLFLLLAPQKKFIISYCLVTTIGMSLVILLAANQTVPCRLVLSGEGSGPINLERVTLAGKARSVSTPDSGPERAPTPTPNPPGGSRLLSGASVDWRLGTFQKTFKDLQENPILGNGANSFAQKYTNSSNSPDWIGNLELMVLHDSGIAGGFFFLGWLGAFGFTGWQVYRRNKTSEDRRLLMALGFSLAGLLVAFQISSAFWLGFCWLYLALFKASILDLQSPKVSNQLPAEISPEDEKDLLTQTGLHLDQTISTSSNFPGKAGQAGTGFNVSEKPRPV